MMKITSPDFAEGGNIPARFTCDGEDISPTLRISDAPAATTSFVLIVDDPDAPDGTWNHWLIWNLRPGLKEIPAGSVPEGAIQGENDFLNNNYGGPCPPSGTHQYNFKLLALNTVLDLPSTSDRKALDQALRGHVVAQAHLMGRYTKK